ncbi:hypothetical protein GGP41_010241 [Bipolaris sorokiniana]|uniref:DNA2/NAM7 helicase-like C-terminal domain-containing protein n=1 Tax=Cochliobolus sativus TaxID=45130 RepID=A0A8H6DWL9_COCSA|nr:hypothetical protein GGP41_010241 [Bipolaris sorokiniana]
MTVLNCDIAEYETASLSSFLYPTYNQLLENRRGGKNSTHIILGELPPTGNRLMQNSVWRQLQFPNIRFCTAICRMSLALECSIASNAEIYHHCLVGLSYWESGKVEIPHYQPHQLAPTDIASTVLNAGTELVRHSSLGGQRGGRGRPDGRVAAERERVARQEAFAVPDPLLDIITEVCSDILYCFSPSTNDTDRWRGETTVFMAIYQRCNRQVIPAPKSKDTCVHNDHHCKPQKEDANNRLTSRYRWRKSTAAATLLVYRTATKSRYNIEFVSCGIRVAFELVKAGFPGSEVAITSAYTAQVATYRYTLHNFIDWCLHQDVSSGEYRLSTQLNYIEIFTVDKMQGDQKEAIIHCTTTSSDLGFTTEATRQLLANSRALRTRDRGQKRRSLPMVTCGRGSQ